MQPTTVSPLQGLSKDRLVELGSIYNVGVSSKVTNIDSGFVAIAGTDDPESCIMCFHGGMSDDERDEVHSAFNGDPTEHPVRILIATDAAREGVNLEGRWAEFESKREGHLKPFADKADQKSVEMLESLLCASQTLDGVSSKVQSKLLQSPLADFSTMWLAIKHEADARAQEATQKLLLLATIESEDVRTILRGQRRAIERAIAERSQMKLEFSDGQRAEHDQYEQDLKHMESQLIAIGKHLEPVGLVYLWPETRG